MATKKKNELSMQSELSSHRSTWYETHVDCTTQRKLTHKHTLICRQVANQLNNTQSLWYTFLLCFAFLLFP